MSQAMNGNDFISAAASGLYQRALTRLCKATKPGQRLLAERKMIGKFNFPDIDYVGE